MERFPKLTEFIVFLNQALQKLVFNKLCVLSWTLSLNQEKKPNGVDSFCTDCSL